MNGRIYDPLLGRFLSADTVVQFPGNLQSYDRYIYVQNNPLTFHDPSGHVLETVWDVANIGIGVASLISNIKGGNVGAAVLDSVGIIADTAAAALPFIPGGASTAIKVARTTATIAGNVEKAGNTIVAADGVVTDFKDGNVNLGTATNALSVAASTKSKSRASTADGGSAPNVSKLDGGDVKTPKGSETGTLASTKGKQAETNRVEGARRQAETKTELQQEHPNASVQSEQYLRNADGTIAKDPITGQGRRIDDVVIEDGKTRPFCRDYQSNGRQEPPDGQRATDTREWRHLCS